MVEFGPPVITMRSYGLWMGPSVWYMGQTAPPLPDLWIQNLGCRRGVEGPQIILAWDPPNEPAALFNIRIVRKLYDFPQHHEDGVILYDGVPQSPGIYVDLDLEECRCYYYTIFHTMGPSAEWYANINSACAIIPVKSGHYLAARLINLLPDNYLYGDKRLGKVNRNRVALSMEQNLTTGEWKNLWETGIEKGELDRFLKNFGAELDYAKGLIDCLPAQFNVSETCCYNLPFIADILGIELNREWSCSKMREEIVKQKYIDRWRGTPLSFEAKARAISGLRAEVAPRWPNVVCTNTPGRGTFDFSLAAAPVFREYGDTNAYVIGDLYYQRLYVLNLFLTEFDCIDQGIVDKLNREMPRYRPACTRHFMRFIDFTWVEENETPTDEYYDEKEDMFAEFYSYTTWFKTNRTGSLTNTPILTPGPGPVHLMDAWWDVITP